MAVLPPALSTRSHSRCQSRPSASSSMSIKLFPTLKHSVEALAASSGSSEVSGSGRDCFSPPLDCAQPVRGAPGVSQAHDSPVRPKCNLAGALRCVHARHHIELLQTCRDYNITPRGLCTAVHLNVVAPRASNVTQVIDLILQGVQAEILDVLLRGRNNVRTSVIFRTFY